MRHDTGPMHHRFHLIIATNRPPEYLDRAIRSIQAEPYRVFLSVVAQRPVPEVPDRLAAMIRDGDGEYIHQPGASGVSTARNAGMRTLRADLVGFPDDDCWYPTGVLSAIDARFSRVDEEPRLGGLCIPTKDATGRGTMLRWLGRSRRIRVRDVPRTVICSGVFFRREVLDDIGDFDDTLGSGVEPFGSGEENDLVMRAVEAGVRVDFDADLYVHHGDFRDDGPTTAVLAKVRRYNRGFGRVLRKHGCWGQASYWVSRSVVALVIARVRRDAAAVEQQHAQLAGRWQGWFGRDDAGHRHPVHPRTR